MKSKQEKIIYPVQSSFKILKYAVPYFDMPLHYHPEYELVYIVKGYGLRYIGDSIHKFKNGDMVFMGPDLAHIWINPKKLKKDSKLLTEAIVLQFSGGFLQSVLDTPEFVLIKELLIKAQNGIKIVGSSRASIVEILENSLDLDGPPKIINLIQILDILSRDKRAVLLNPIEYRPQPSRGDKRIIAVSHLVMSSFNQRLTVGDAATVANMEQSAFCRYFKEKTLKTFTGYLNETRVDHACRLLLENKLPVSQIAYECGFNAMANFYRQFKKITGVTPGEYRK